ncbi:MAG TPA: pyrroline-5-carboxylate reductase [Candidatus Binataceae bacterium]|nr:pyrroline-5-carboxylate reductase [Candidatus Binataceae bacterium]
MKKLGFIGGGNMGEAMIHGLLVNRVFKASDLIASDPEPARRRRLARLFKIATTASNREVLASGAGALLIAVKPQIIDPVMDELRATMAAAVPPRAKRGAGGRLFISIAAGVTIARLERGLGPRARVIRVMPNGPAMVGYGMTAMVRGRIASRADERFAMRLFGAVGEAVALRDEAMLDAVTALSGSGPAYVYLFAKALVDAAIADGLPPELSFRMTLQTIRGAEESMRQLKLEPAELIRRVASPGGTTEAALRRFDAEGFSAIVAHAIHAAAERSRELGRGA